MRSHVPIKMLNAKLVSDPKFIRRCHWYGEGEVERSRMCVHSIVMILLNFPWYRNKEIKQFVFCWVHHSSKIEPCYFFERKKKKNFLITNSDKRIYDLIKSERFLEYISLHGCKYEFICWNSSWKYPICQSHL